MLKVLGMALAEASRVALRYNRPRVQVKRRVKLSLWILIAISSLTFAQRVDPRPTGALANVNYIALRDLAEVTKGKIASSKDSSGTLVEIVFPWGRFSVVANGAMAKVSVDGNFREVTLKAPAFILNGSAYIPVTSVEFLGCLLLPKTEGFLIDCTYKGGSIWEGKTLLWNK